MPYISKKDMTLQQLELCRTAAQWDKTVDNIIKDNGGYPNWWYTDVIASGLLKRTAAKWGDDGEIKITQF